MYSDSIKRRYIAAFIVAITVIASVIALASSLPSQQVTGKLTIAIKDAPVDLSRLEVTIDSIEVQSQSNSWVQIPFVDGVQSVTVDLLTLKDIVQELSTTQIPTGNYNGIRIQVTNAKATYPNGNVVDLTVPSEKMDIIVHFQINAGSTTSVLIDMQPNTVAISDTLNLKPVLKATVASPTPTPTSPNPSVFIPYPSFNPAP